MRCDAVRMGDSERLLAAVCDAVRRAGRTVRDARGKHITVTEKSDGLGPVTSADLAAQAVLLDALAVYGYPVCSEERDVASERLDATRVWMVDPLDGTKEFLRGTGEYSVMVGLVEHGSPVLGVVYLPALDRCYSAAAGCGAFVEEGGVRSSVRVSERSSAAAARMLVSRSHLLDTERRLATAMGVGAVIPCGSAGIKMCRVAAGEAEVYVNSSSRTGEWDTCAPECILTEAGGVVRDLRGDPLVYNKPTPMNPNGFVATNGRLRNDVHAALRLLAAPVL